MNWPQPEAFHPRDCLEMAVAHGNVHRQSFTCILFSGEGFFFGIPPMMAVSCWKWPPKNHGQHLAKAATGKRGGRHVVSHFETYTSTDLSTFLKIIFPRIGWFERFWNQQIRNISISILWSHLFHLFACQERENHVLFLRQVKPPA